MERIKRSLRRGLSNTEEFHDVVIPKAPMSNDRLSAGGARFGSSEGTTRPPRIPFLGVHVTRYFASYDAGAVANELEEKSRGYAK